ncbi:hypothetical protein BDW71DRAFT_98260 [Aspergillus fruticulosus]
MSLVSLLFQANLQIMSVQPQTLPSDEKQYIDRGGQAAFVPRDITALCHVFIIPSEVNIDISLFLTSRLFSDVSRLGVTAFVGINREYIRPESSQSSSRTRCS